MPRISFDYVGLAQWCESTGNGSSTFDVCNECFAMDSATLLSKLGGPYNGEPRPNGEITHEDTGEENPYLHDGEHVECECCGRKLILNKNY